MFSLKDAVSNSLTIRPLPKVPRSPPCFPDGHSESSLAMLANFSPLLRRSRIFFASVSVFTSMCAQWTLSGMGGIDVVFVNNLFEALLGIVYIPCTEKTRLRQEGFMR